MKRILSLLIVLCTLFPQTAWGYVYNEPHTFQTQLETARNKTVAITTAHVDRYTWDTIYNPLTNGTGTMIGDGLILTNAHVIGDNQNSITVRTYTGESYEGELLRVDKEKDLALVRFDYDAEGFTLSDVSLYRGKPIMTVGQPAGLPQWSFSEGTVQTVSFSATMLTGESYTAIQTDAQVIQGNSGGPLIDDKGELVGIVRATGGSYSYAVPMSDIREFLKEVQHD